MLDTIRRLLAWPGKVKEYTGGEQGLGGATHAKCCAFSAWF